MYIRQLPGGKISFFKFSKKAVFSVVSCPRAIWKQALGCQYVVSMDVHISCRAKVWKLGETPTPLHPTPTPQLSNLHAIFCTAFTIVGGGVVAAAGGERGHLQNKKRRTTADRKSGSLLQQVSPQLFKIVDFQDVASEHLNDRILSHPYKVRKIIPGAPSVHCPNNPANFRELRQSKPLERKCPGNCRKMSYHFLGFLGNFHSRGLLILYSHKSACVWDSVE